MYKGMLPQSLSPEERMRKQSLELLDAILFRLEEMNLHDSHEISTELQKMFSRVGIDSPHLYGNKNTTTPKRTYDVHTKKWTETPFIGRWPASNRTVRLIEVVWELQKKFLKGTKSESDDERRGLRNSLSSGHRVPHLKARGVKKVFSDPEGRKERLRRAMAGNQNGLKLKPKQVEAAVDFDEKVEVKSKHQRTKEAIVRAWQPSELYDLRSQEALCICEHARGTHRSDEPDDLESCQACACANFVYRDQLPLSTSSEADSNLNLVATNTDSDIEYGTSVEERK